MKHIFTALLILASTSILAQVVPNGGFENWETSQGNVPWKGPQSWSTSNPFTEFITPNVNPIAPGHTGDSACELTTLNIFNNEAPAFIVNGSCEYDFNNFNADFRYSGTPTTTAYHYLHGYYKYSSQTNGDSAFIAVAYKKWNASKGASDTIAQAFALLPPAASYTEFQVDISHIGFASVDSVVIIIVSTDPRDQNNIKGGGQLTIDDLSMDMINSTGHYPQAVNVTIYPNPADDVVTVTTGSNAQINSIHIIDITGKTVLDRDYYNTSEAKLEVAEIKTGIYFIKINTNKGIITRKLVVKSS